MCHFFSFADEHDKHEAPRLILCCPLKLQKPAFTSVIGGKVASRMEVPDVIMSELHSLEEAELRLPINEVLHSVLVTVLYQAELLDLLPRRENESLPGLEEAVY